MTVKDILKTLKSMGTAQNRRVYARHGYPQDTHGVSFSNLRALAKQIGTDHAVARELWASGNGDARVLALMVGDPMLISNRDLDRWAKDVSFYVLADMLSGFVARSSVAQQKCEKWMDDTSDFLAQMGWNLCGILTAPEHGIPDDWFDERLEHIEYHIHAVGNRTRHAMNMALCAIGGYRATLRRKAVAVATRIGTVVVDHGETGCKTPDAVVYIQRIAARSGGEPAIRPKTTTTKKTRKKAASGARSGAKTKARRAAP